MSAPAFQRRVLVVLATAQVLGGVGIATALAVSTLVAARLSGSEAVGGFALTCVVLGTAGAALVLSRVATRAGRRPALGLGYGVGALGPFLLCAAAFGLAALVTGAGLRPDPLLLARAARPADPDAPPVDGGQVRAALLASPAALLGVGATVLVAGWPPRPPRRGAGRRGPRAARGPRPSGAGRGSGTAGSGSAGRAR